MDLHGGNTYKIIRENKINELLDYSSNINPFGVPDSLKNLLIENMDELVKYPDPEYYDLRKKIADFNNVKVENILVGNGATELIFLYMKTLKPNKVLIISPTFAEYERAISCNEAKVNHFELKEEEDFKLDINKLKSELKKSYDLLVICNPNNPTGNLINLEEMTEIYDTCLKHNTNLFVDETFLEFTEKSLEDSIGNVKIDKTRLFILRAFTKFFGIPGIRLGYALCFDEDLLKDIKKIREPWTVNSFANLAGIHLLDNEDYIEKSKKWIQEEKKNFANALKSLEGVKYYKTTTNFILIKLMNTRANKLREYLIDKGVLVRDASNFKFLNDKFIRLAIKDRESNKIVIDKLNEALKNLNDGEEYEN